MNKLFRIKTLKRGFHYFGDVRVFKNCRQQESEDEE